ncbi:MAG: co-chaperone GroES [Candidatus Nomurabacteria bacterium]|jgi:chaperonin GroES|nr:co-chaperone GroES [Candidatus Nomurabacteria bacterium]
MSKVPIKPIGQRVVAVAGVAETKTASGLYLPDGAKEKSRIARVVAVGDGVKSVKPNDQIVYKEYATTDIKVAGVDYIIVKEEDVLATVE